MDGSTRPQSKYRETLDLAVSELEAHVARVQERFDEREQRKSEHRTNRYEDALAEAKKALKQARAKLTTYTKLPHAELEAQIEKLRAEIAPAKLDEALEGLRPLLVAAAVQKVRVFVEVMRVRSEFINRVKGIQDIERALLSDETRILPVHDQPGYSRIHGPVEVARDELLAELVRLMGTDDEIAKSLSADDQGQLRIAGMAASVALDWAGLT